MKTSAGLACEISAECVARSQLLRDLTDTDGAANEASIPVSEDAFRLWMHHVNAGGCGPCLTPEASGQTFAVNGVDDPSPSRIVSVADAPAGQTQACDDSVDGEDPLSAASAAERLCQLVTVADVLIDEDTKNTTAARLAALLQRHAAKSSSDIADQVFALLPEPLLQPVLAPIPLEHVLRHLPAAFHTAALLAHHPSIDSSNSLHLHRIPPDLLKPALAASATVSTLADLSLAGSTLPLACGACIKLLAGMSSVTELSLNDAGLTEKAADALATALPAMQHLRCLNVSRNRLSPKAWQTLAPALRDCGPLRSLSMSRLEVQRPLATHLGTTVKQAVAAAAPLQQLTELSFGFVDSMAGSKPIAAQAVQLFAGIRSMHDMQKLDLNLLGVVVTEAQAERVADTLSNSTQLSVLRLVLPKVKGHAAPTGPAAAATGRATGRVNGRGTGRANGRTAAPANGRSNGHAAPAVAAAAEPNLFGEAIGRCTALTCLQLRLGQVSTSGAASLLGHVAALPALCELRLQVDAGIRSVSGDNVASAVAEKLPQMTQLSLLHLAASGTIAEPRPAVQLALAEAAAAAPELRELRLSLSMHERTNEFAMALLGATQLQRAWVDLSLGHIFRQDAPGEEWKALVPIVPHVDAVNVWCMDAPLRVQPLAVMAGALTNLRVLSVNPGRYVAAAEVQGLLSSVSCMTALQHLRCCFALTQQHGPREVAAPLKVAPFCDGLRGLSSLTSLWWDVSGSAEAPRCQRLVLRACSALTGLQSLGLGDLFKDARVQFSRVVPLLPLRRLEVRLAKLDAVAMEGGESAEVVAEVIKQLPHLREACVCGMPDSKCRHMLRTAAKEHPACHLEFPER